MHHRAFVLVSRTKSKMDVAKVGQLNMNIRMEAPVDGRPIFLDLALASGPVYMCWMYESRGKKSTTVFFSPLKVGKARHRQQHLFWDCQTVRTYRDRPLSKVNSGLNALHCGFTTLQCDTGFSPGLLQGLQLFRLFQTFPFNSFRFLSTSTWTMMAMGCGNHGCLCILLTVRRLACVAPWPELVAAAMMAPRDFR